VRRQLAAEQTRTAGQHSAKVPPPGPGFGLDVATDAVAAVRACLYADSERLLAVIARNPQPRVLATALAVLAARAIGNAASSATSAEAILEAERKSLTDLVLDFHLQVTKGGDV